METFDLFLFLFFIKKHIFQFLFEQIVTVETAWAEIHFNLTQFEN